MKSTDATSAVTATIWPGWMFAPVPTARSASFWRRSGSMTGGYRSTGVARTKPRSAGSGRHGGRAGRGGRPHVQVRLHPAVGEAEDAEPALVAEPFLDCVLDDAEEVVGVDVAPALVDRPGEVEAVAHRAARVGVDDGDPRVREREHLEPRRRAVGDVRAAVDVEDERPPARASSAAHDPCLDLVPVQVCHRERFRVGAPAAEPTAPVARERAEPAVLDGADLARATAL